MPYMMKKIRHICESIRDRPKFTICKRKNTLKTMDNPSQNCLIFTNDILKKFSTGKEGRGGLAQWLASRTTDQGSLVQDLAGSLFVVALSESHLPPARLLVKPRKPWTYD